MDFDFRKIARMAYISGPLTNVSGLEKERLIKLYEKIGSICERVGLIPYLPHKETDPDTTVHLTPAEVDCQDRFALTFSGVVIAYVGLPSLETGIEIEMAYHANKPVILIFEAGRKVSRLVLGNPAVKVRLDYSDEEQLERFLIRHLSDPSLNILKVKRSHVGNRIRDFKK